MYPYHWKGEKLLPVSEKKKRNQAELFSLENQNNIDSVNKHLLKLYYAPGP
jgi:hypothetical protein